MDTNLLWFLSALGGTSLWALNNVLDGALRNKFIKDDLTLTWLSGVIRFPFVILFFLLGGIELSNTTGVLMMLLSGVLSMLPFILYFKALEDEEASRVSLLLQFVPLSTLFIAYFLLDETLSGFQLFAFLLLLTGGVLASLKRNETKLKLSKAFLLMIVACSMWSLSDVIFKKYEVDFSDFNAAFAIYFLGTFITAIFFYLYSKKQKHHNIQLKALPAKAWWLLILSVTASNIGYMSFSYALTLKEASLTTVIMGIQPLMVMILGFILSKFIKEIEKDDLTKEALLFKVFSFLLIIGGIILLQLK